MNDTVNEINTACINDAVEIVSRLKPIYTLKHARETARRPIPVRKRSSCPYTKVNWYAEVPQKQHLIYLQITAFKR